MTKLDDVRARFRKGASRAEPEPLIQYVYLDTAKGLADAVKASQAPTWFIGAGLTDEADDIHELYDDHAPAIIYSTAPLALPWEGPSWPGPIPPVLFTSLGYGDSKVLQAIVERAKQSLTPMTVYFYTREQLTQACREARTLKPRRFVGEELSPITFTPVKTRELRPRWLTHEGEPTEAELEETTPTLPGTSHEWLDCPAPVPACGTSQPYIHGPHPIPTTTTTHAVPPTPHRPETEPQLPSDTPDEGEHEGASEGGQEEEERDTGSAHRR